MAQATDETAESDESDEAGRWRSPLLGVGVSWSAPWALETEASCPDHDLLRLVAGRLMTEVYALPWDEPDPPAILRRFLEAFRAGMPDLRVTQEWNRGGARPIPLVVEYRQE